MQISTENTNARFITNFRGIREAFDELLELEHRINTPEIRVRTIQYQNLTPRGKCDMNRHNPQTVMPFSWGRLYTNRRDTKQHIHPTISRSTQFGNLTIRFREKIPSHHNTIRKIGINKFGRFTIRCRGEISVITVSICKITDTMPIGSE